MRTGVGSQGCPQVNITLQSLFDWGMYLERALGIGVTAVCPEKERLRAAV